MTAEQRYTLDHKVLVGGYWRIAAQQPPTLSCPMPYPVLLESDDDLPKLLIVDRSMLIASADPPQTVARFEGTNSASIEVGVAKYVRRRVRIRARSSIGVVLLKPKAARRFARAVLATATQAERSETS